LRDTGGVWAARRRLAIRGSIDASSGLIDFVVAAGCAAALRAIASSLGARNPDSGASVAAVLESLVSERIVD
jgi:hypothetical protein